VVVGSVKVNVPPMCGRKYLYAAAGPLEAVSPTHLCAPSSCCAIHSSSTPLPLSLTEENFGTCLLFFFSADAIVRCFEVCKQRRRVAQAGGWGATVVVLFTGGTDQGIGQMRHSEFTSNYIAHAVIIHLDGCELAKLSSPVSRPACVVRD